MMTLQENAQSERKRNTKQSAPESASELLIQINRQNPDADRNERIRLFVEHARNYPAIGDECADFWCRLADRNIIGGKETDEQRQSRTKQARTLLWSKMISLEFIMPDGRQLGDWTFGELKNIGGFLAALSEKGGSDEKVRSKLTTKQLRQIAEEEK